MRPKTFLVGVTNLDIDGLRAYLEHTQQTEFLNDLNEAIKDGTPPGLCLVSFYAKLCYRSLVEGKNSNIKKTRSIHDNIIATMKSGHGSVFEHCWLNFVTTNCSRVFTHELVRHRVGTAFSQTSGRYCTVEDAELVIPPELDNQDDPRLPSIAEDMQSELLRLKERVAHWRTQLKLDEEKDFGRKKRLTSALRRIMPNGATNEIGWSCNIRSLRHMLEMRTSRHAEWEIRVVFNDVFYIVNERWPLMLCGAGLENVDGLLEVTGLKI